MSAKSKLSFYFFFWGPYGFLIFFLLPFGGLMYLLVAFDLKVSSNRPPAPEHYQLIPQFPVRVTVKRVINPIQGEVEVWVSNTRTSFTRIAMPKMSDVPKLAVGDVVFLSAR